MKIGVVNAAWGNMGNAFFQIGLSSWLRNQFPEHEIYEIEDPHGVRPPAKYSQNKLPLIRMQDVDLFIFSGPILAQILRAPYPIADIILELKDNKKKYALVSVSSAEMSSNEVERTAEFLNKYPPVLFLTRDEQTYINFKDRCDFCENSICTAFLVRYIEGIPKVNMGQPYFISSFYLSVEPTYTTSLSLIDKSEDVEVTSRRSLLPFLRIGYTRHLEFLRKDYLSEIGGHKIVRVHQGFNPKASYFNYGQPNSFVSYNPRSYLSLYKSCKFVISDRVHSCAAALSFGHEARLLTENDRCGIFARFGLKKNKHGVINPINEDLYQKRVNELFNSFNKVL